MAPTPRVPPTPRSDAGVQGRSFIIWAKSARRTQITFPSWARPATACSRKSRCSRGQAPRAVGQGAEGPPEGGEHLLGVAHREQVDGRGVAPLDQRDLELAHEPGRRHPEIVPDQHEALDASAVALPQRLDQLALGRLPPRVQPLLELVEHDQDLLARRQAWPRRRLARAAGSPSACGRSGQCFASAAISRASVRSAVAST